MKFENQQIQHEPGKTDIFLNIFLNNNNNETKLRAAH